MFLGISVKLNMVFFQRILNFFSNAWYVTYMESGFFHRHSGMAVFVLVTNLVLHRTKSKVRGLLEFQTNIFNHFNSILIDRIIGCDSKLNVVFIIIISN